MKLKISLVLLSLVTFFIFVVFSYSVAKESWQQIDFDVTVKLQDRISRSFDQFFSYFSLIGSAEITFSIAAAMAFLSLIRFKILAFIGWLLIIPASFFEVFGKLVVFHPSPPVLFHRSILETNLPSFYVHTNFSYPSGHMTRTAFLITVFCIVILSMKIDKTVKFFLILGLLVFEGAMFVTRVYLGEHWLSDVIGGFLLGSAAGLFSSILIFKRKKKYLVIN